MAGFGHGIVECIGASIAQIPNLPIDHPYTGSVHYYHQHRNVIAHQPSRTGIWPRPYCGWFLDCLAWQSGHQLRKCGDECNPAG